MDYYAHSMLYALMVRRDRGKVEITEIPESCVCLAKDMGWEYLIQDSDLLAPKPTQPTQRNPNRNGDTGGD